MTEIDSIVPVSADQADLAAFSGVDAALRFAYGYRQRGLPDTLARYQRRGGDLSIFDGIEERAAWAGDIRRRIGTLHPTRQAVLIVRFAPRASPCACRRPCCSGWARNEEWTESLSRLVDDAIQAVPGQISNRQLRLGIVRRWAGADRTNLQIIAEKCGVHRNTAGKQAKSIRRWLDQLEAAALQDADNCLTADGHGTAHVVANT